MSTDKTWAELTRRFGDIEALDHINGMLQWDQQTHMPAGGAAGRARQNAVLSAIRHERWTDPSIGELLSTLEAADDLSSDQAAGVRNLRRDWDRSVKLPVSLVERLARARAGAFSAWAAAKEADDFDSFVPALTQVFDLTREMAGLLHTDEDCLYDALLAEFDPGATAASLNTMFDRLAGELNIFLDTIEGRPTPPDLEGPFPLEGQRTFSQELIKHIGYDLSRGRLDEAEHPFTVGFGVGDVRITTHFYEHDLLSGMGGTVHEVGHALYEQGLPAALSGTGAGTAAGMGLHESQSRFWENYIGRSLPFSQLVAPMLERHFPGRAVDPTALYHANNRVRRSLIRISADEVTYNLHIIVRARLEQAIFAGDLAVADLRGAWDDAYAEVVGVRPDNAKDGVLQDVHWASGAIGYFPSYTIGNLYAASLGAKLSDELPSLWDKVGAGEFAPILGWLRENIHSKGHLKDAPEIIRDAVGDRDPVEDLVSYLWGRHGAIYGVERPRA